MAISQEILDAATGLGRLIAKHESAVKLENALKRLQGDVEAQRLFNDYHRHLEKINEKQANGQPIEVEDKRRLANLQDMISHSEVLRDLQIGQMDYVDLMRQVDEAISGQSSLGSLNMGPTAAAGQAVGQSSLQE